MFSAATISLNTYVSNETTFLTVNNLNNATFLEVSIINSFGQIVTNNKFNVVNKYNFLEPIIDNSKLAT